MFLDGRFPSLAKTATDIAVVGMFLDKSDKGWFLTESLWGPQGSVLKREPRVRDLARLLSCVLGQEAVLSARSASTQSTPNSIIGYRRIVKKA